MLKNAFEKWEEVKENSSKDKKYITSYYLGNKTAAKLFFGIDDEKMCLYLEFTSEVLVDLEIPKLKGMFIDIISEPSIDLLKKYILIRNETQNEAIFEAFSSSLVDELANVSSYYDTYEAFKRVVKEYKDYFANPNRSLSKQEEQGLCAELLELSNLIDTMGQKVVDCWQGPSKNKRDFVFENCAIEIKSTLSQENTSILISNENQLDYTYPSSLKNLFLKVYIMEDSDNGFDVNKCIEQVFNKLTSISLKNIFLASLLKLKIDPNTYISKYKFTIQKESVYKICEDFPSITTKFLPKEIYNVSYRLKIGELDRFMIEEDKMNVLL